MGSRQESAIDPPGSPLKTSCCQIGVQINNHPDIVEKYTGNHWLQLCGIDAGAISFNSFGHGLVSSPWLERVQLQESLAKCTCGEIRKPSGYVCLDLQVTQVAGCWQEHLCWVKI